ncbi:MAG: hypothetical protein WCD76_17740, partial [Pyrinomonadaceae bacterium]
IAALGVVDDERRALLNDGCGPDCGHSDEEHWAFDGGLAAGERGEGEETCTLDGLEREAWLYGHSVGAGNRSATLAASGDSVEAAPPVVPPRIFKSTIEVPLTEHDLAEKAILLSNKQIQIDELEAEKKQSNEGYNAKIGGLKEECSQIHRSVRARRDELELDVYERRDYERRVVETVRVDCGDVVAERAMKPTEFQRPLIEL